MSETANEAKQPTQETWQDYLKDMREIAPAIGDWIDSLGWKDEELISFETSRPIYPIGTDEQGRLNFKPSTCFIVTVKRQSGKEAENPVSTQEAIFGTVEGQLQLI